MDKSTILRAFNTHFTELIDDILAVFPDDVDIIATKNGLISIRKANPKMIPMIWNECIGIPYGPEIASGDIDFFINKDYSHDIGSASYGNAIMSKIDNLRTPVRNMGGENQYKVLKYIQNLTKLAAMLSPPKQINGVDDCST